MKRLNCSKVKHSNKIVFPKIILNDEYVCVSVCGFVHMSAAAWRRPEALDPPGAGDTGERDARNQVCPLHR